MHCSTSAQHASWSEAISSFTFTKVSKCERTDKKEESHFSVTRRHYPLVAPVVQLLRQQFAREVGAGGLRDEQREAVIT